MSIKVRVQSYAKAINHIERHKKQPHNPLSATPALPDVLKQMEQHPHVNYAGRSASSLLPANTTTSAVSPGTPQYFALTLLLRMLGTST